MNSRSKQFKMFPRQIVLGALLVFLAGCFTVPPPIESHFNRGVEAYDQGKLADAIHHYKLELAQNPDHPFARYNLAVAYQDQENYDLAIEHYTYLLKTRNDTHSRINLASIYHTQGKEDLALQQLQAAAQSNPDDPNAHSVWGHYMEEKGDHQNAHEHYLKALAIDNEHAISHYRLGRVQRKLGMKSKAVESLQKSIELDPEQSEPLLELADHYVSEDQTLSAIDMLERVAVLEPDRADIFIRLGKLYTEARYFKQATNHYWSASAIEPDNAQIHRELKSLFETLIKEEKEMLDHLDQQRAVAQSPASP